MGHFVEYGMGWSFEYVLLFKNRVAIALDASICGFFRIADGCKPMRRAR
jgi:hypothetical protein